MTSILERRRIEAEFAAGVYDVLKAEFGEETATRLLKTMIVGIAEKTGRDFADKEGRPVDLATFKELLALWQADDALAIEWLEASPDKLAFNVTRCRYAEMYRELGLGHLGKILSCSRDGAFCSGYDPKATFERTTTIMEGAPVCDFRYAHDQEKK